eukprot:964146-Alexandrium_andersonii.AAC.1
MDRGFSQRWAYWAVSTRGAAGPWAAPESMDSGPRIGWGVPAGGHAYWPCRSSESGPGPHA